MVLKLAKDDVELLARPLNKIRGLSPISRLAIGVELFQDCFSCHLLRRLLSYLSCLFHLCVASGISLTFGGHCSNIIRLHLRQVDSILFVLDGLPVFIGFIDDRLLISLWPSNNHAARQRLIASIFILEVTGIMHAIEQISDLLNNLQQFRLKYFDRRNQVNARQLGTKHHECR